MDKRRDDRLSSRLVAIAALGFLLITPPLLSRFDRGSHILGVPLVWAYLFFVWAIIIALTALVAARSDKAPG